MNFNGFKQRHRQGLMTFAEQRRHERVMVDIHVYWGWTNDCPFYDRIISLSEGGYFLRTERGAPRGQSVFIKFWLPEQKTLGGEVRYHLERWGIGVEFRGLSDNETDLLTTLVEHYRETVKQ